MPSSDTDNASSIDQSSAVMSHRALWPNSVRSLLTGTSSSALAGRARARRWDSVSENFSRPRTAKGRGPRRNTSILVCSCSIRLKEVLTVMNLAASSTPAPNWVKVVTGDACKAADLGLQKDYDLVFSNSTIEHVGGHDRCLAFCKDGEDAGSSALDPDPLPILSNRAALRVSGAPVPAHRPATARGVTLAAELHEVHGRQSRRSSERCPVDRVAQPHSYEVLFP